MKKKFLASVLCLSLSVSSLFASNVADNKKDGVTTKSSKTSMSSLSDTDINSIKNILSHMPKFKGYLQTGYQFVSNGNKSTSSFQAKRFRLIMDGNVAKNISVRMQLECFNGIGATTVDGHKNIQVMDAFATAKITDGFQVRAGRYYLPLGYENYDISPATLETVNFSNIVYSVVCRNPYSYNYVDYGRDLGVMLMGNLFKSEDGYSHLSYNLSLSNGATPYKDDNNKQKDVIAALTYRPCKFMNIKASYNYGQYDGTINGVDYTNQRMSRYVIGAWYNDPKGLDLRAEYAGINSTKGGSDVATESAFYALAAYHINKFLPVVRYDFYKDDVNKTSLNNFDRLLVGLTYNVVKNVKVQANYAYVTYKDAAKVSNNGEDDAHQLQIMAIFSF